MRMRESPERSSPLCCARLLVCPIWTWPSSSRRSMLTALVSSPSVSGLFLKEVQRKAKFSVFCFSSSCTCLFSFQVNFKPLPRPTRNTPSSSPHTWSFRDIKRSRRRCRAIWNWPVRAVQGINRKKAPLTKKTTEYQDDRELSLRETEHWNHCTEKEKQKKKVSSALQRLFF